MRKITVLLPATLLVTLQFCSAAAVDQVGSYAYWPTTWTAIGPSTTEGTGEVAEAKLDFVGSTSGTDRGLYFAQNSSYAFFRMRVAATSFPDLKLEGNNYLNGSYILAIDSNQDGTIEYGFAWDAKNSDSANIATHGLEMVLLNGTQSTWSATNMQDLDGSVSTKGTVDINGGSRTTDGYIRTDQETISTVTTTVIDFAVSWDYMKTNVPSLYGDWTWSVAAASITNANDHGNMNGDVMGDVKTGTISGSPAWSTAGFTAVPEPTPALAGLLIGAGLLRRRRK